ncbi:hypothetical protein PF006_g7509 [Phytophthora fragariae]|uniref:Uncharacterized protein n=1 Tax=Phytophthora fragariae TaxID=53985 RepID=A0A6A3U8L7_9STRA|nr:hypothetical protein PF006_g7509 [Phytophthora fragariae]KAE9350110.1 hypothetical protein PF008_g6598 [Phytophthora fragariae]
MQFGGAPEVRRHTADRIDRIWGLYNEAVVAGDSSGYVLSRYKENSGRNYINSTASRVDVRQQAGRRSSPDVLDG